MIPIANEPIDPSNASQSISGALAGFPLQGERYTLLFPLKRRSEAFQAIRTFTNKWENQLDHGSLEAKASWREKGLLCLPAITRRTRVERPHLMKLQSTRYLLGRSGSVGCTCMCTIDFVPWSKFTSNIAKISLFHAFGGNCWFQNNATRMRDSSITR